ncbi:hypothetical protein LUZ60_016712 [Juncus effusus]|nr:hypothetical protein LUZ60_016712 [Juncus effusus]
MCIAAWIWQSHPSHQLLLLFNRDEFHNRPTSAVKWWGEVGKEILGGRDELGGGTWLGCTRDCKIAFLTNFADPNYRSSDAKSRGNLPVRFLQSKKSPMECAEEIERDADSYNGFSLVMADIRLKSMVYITNRPKGKFDIKTVNPGIHVLSNAHLDAPWPKSVRLRRKLEDYITGQGDKEIDLKEVIKLMEDNKKADRSALPKTGVDPELEFDFSSKFIDNCTRLGRNQYGTRSMSCIAIKIDNEVSFYERYLESTSSGCKEHITQFQTERNNEIREGME